MVVLEPVPSVGMVPGRRVSVHVPVEGRLESTTLPVETRQVGGVIVPTVGLAGKALTVTVVTADGSL